MLQLYDLSRNKIAGLTNYKDLRVERELSGDEVLFFSYPQVDKEYDNIKEECYIRTRKNEYVIKEVNIQDDWTGFVAKVNVESIKGTPFSNFETIEQTCTDTVNLALVGTGWTIGSCDVTKRRTIRKSNCSSYDILQEIRKVYMCNYFFDAISKKIYIRQSMGSDKGVYFIDELNLQTLNVQSNSYDYCTRIIPVGKDGLKITSINGGKEYVENYQYSDKVITIYWEDNRYEVAANLKEDAEYKLNEVSKPVRAYSTDVYDLANINVKYKNVLDYDLGDTITLLSKDKRVRDKQRIVKLIEYPDEPERNSCEIANRTLTFEDMQADVLNATDTVTTVTTSDNKIDNSKIDFDPLRLEVEALVAERAYISDLNAAVARIGTLEVTSATITQLNATNANIDTLEANKADINDLTASNARITTLEADTASINTLLAGNIGAANIAAGAIQAGSSIIAQGAIGSAQISELSASKIAAGTIDTAVVTISGVNGRLKITGNRMQVFAGTTTPYERVSIGDVNGDGTVYGFRVRGADGTTVLLDETGVKREGITDGSINNAKIAGDANISGTKLDITSVVTSINNGTTTIQGSKIFLDGGTLDVKFSNLSTTVSNIQVGGRNLLKNTSNFPNTTNWSLSMGSGQTGLFELVTDSIYGKVIHATKTNNVSWWVLANYPTMLPGNKFTIGKQYTLSFTAKSNTAGSVLGVNFMDTNGQNVVFSGQNATLTTSWAKYSMTFTATATGNIPELYMTYGLAELWLTNVKLEEGNKATDWTPAPEDIQGQIDTQQTTITSHSSQITANTNAIALKVDTTTYNTKMTSLDGSITSINTTLSTQSSSITVLQNQIVTKVTQTDIDNSITPLQNDITAQDTRITSAESSITTLNNSIALKVSTSDFTSYQTSNNNAVSSLTSRMTTAESSIDVLEGSIVTKVTQTDVNNSISPVQDQIDAQELRISTAETKITPTAIVSTVRSSTEYTTDQGLKVNKATVISEINQSAEAIKIQAGKIDINGAVTFNSLDDAMKKSLSQGLLSNNSIFANWTSTFPAGYCTWGTGAITKETTLTRNGGFGARFTVPTLGTQMGMGMYSSAYVSNPNNNKYLFLEVDFMLVSGSLSGSCVLVDWAGMGTYRSQTNLATEVPSPTIGKWYSIRKVIQRPSDTLTGWTGMAGYVLANWNGSGDAVKDIIFDRVSIREATQQEIDLFTNKSGWDTVESTVNSNSANWTDAKTKVDLWKHDSDTTKIDGGTIYTNSITADKMIIADTHNYVAWPLKGTSTASPWTSRATVDSSTYYNAVASFKIPASTTLVEAKNKIPVKSGDKFYVEYMFKTDSSFNGTNSLTKLRFGNQSGTMIYSLTPTIAVNTSWVKYSGEFTVPSGTVWLMPTIGYDGTAGFVWYDDIVIAKQNGGELLVDGTISTDKVTSNFGTSLDISSNTSITSKVSTSQFSSLITQNADSVKIAFGNTPSVNVLPNGRGVHGLVNWRNNGLQDVWLPATNGGSQYTYCPFGGKNGFGLYKSTAGEGFLETDTIRVVPGKTYTFAGNFIKESNVLSYEVYVIGSANNDRAYTWTSNIVGASTNNGFKTATFTVPSNINYLYIRIDHNGGNGTTSAIVLWTTDLQLVEGDKVGEWTPYSGEMRTANVVMNGEGLTVVDGNLDVTANGRRIFTVQNGYHFNEWGMSCKMPDGSAAVKISQNSAYSFTGNESCNFRPFGITHESLSNPRLCFQLLTNTNRIEFRDLDANIYKGAAVSTVEADSFIYSNSYISGANIINRSLRDIKTDITRYDDNMAYEGIKGVNIYNFNMGCNDSVGNPITSLNLGIMVDEAPMEITQLGGGDGADRQGINLYSYASYLASALKTAISKIEALENEVEILKGGVV